MVCHPGLLTRPNLAAKSCSDKVIRPCISSNGYLYPLPTLFFIYFFARLVSPTQSQSRRRQRQALTLGGLINPWVPVEREAVQNWRVAWERERAPYWITEGEGRHMFSNRLQFEERKWLRKINPAAQKHEDAKSEEDEQNGCCYVSRGWHKKAWYFAADHKRKILFTIKD